MVSVKNPVCHNMAFSLKFKHTRASPVAANPYFCGLLRRAIDESSLHNLSFPPVIPMGTHIG